MIHATAWHGPTKATLIFFNPFYNLKRKTTQDKSIYSTTSWTTIAESLNSYCAPQEANP